MKKLDCNDYFTCRMQGKVFELSLKKCKTSSPVFIRRFMHSEIARSFDDRTIILSSVDPGQVIEIIEDEYGPSTYGKIKFSNEVMYWIGYFYRVLSLYFKLSSKSVYRTFPLEDIKKFYFVGHTFDPEYAADRIAEEKGFNPNFTEEGVKILKRLRLLDRLKKLIGSTVKVFIDRPIGSVHNGITYKQNYGYVKEPEVLKVEFQEAYVIGVNEILDSFEGKVLCVIHRKVNDEGKLVVCDKNTSFTDDEVKEMVSFQESAYKYKIIR